MQAIKITTEQPELKERFNRVLGQVVETMDASGIRYAFIGGIASGGQGRPRATHDIDIFVRPEDAELTLRNLEANGFTIERTDPSWLYKAWKEGILVDVIFKSKGEFYLDNDLYDRTTFAEFHGKRLRMVGPEDLTIIKASAHSELTPGHWHDALALLSHATLDWDYFVRRARRAPRRVLSLLIYAHSSDIWVPKQVIDELYGYVYGEVPYPQVEQRAPARPMPAAWSKERAVRAVPQPPAGAEHYAAAHFKERLAQDERCSELDIEVDVSEGKVLLRGEVMAEDRRRIIEEIARESFPDKTIENQVRITPVHGPSEPEEVE